MTLKYFYPQIKKYSNLKMTDLIDNMTVTETTKGTYKKQLEYVTNTLKIDYEDNEDVMLDVLKEVETNEVINKVLSYVNIIYVLRKALSIKSDKLLEYRKHLFDRNTIERSETNKKNVNLPTKAELVKYTFELFNKKNYKKFIINYLIITTNCRNKDLDLYITDRSQDNDKMNYLCLNGDKVEYYRNMYKTVNKRGPKKHIIVNKQFIEAVKNMMNKHLLNNTGGNISKEIIEATYNNLGQARYLKILLLETEYEDIHKIGENRGTSGATLLSHYDMSKGERIRMNEAMFS